MNTGRTFQFSFLRLAAFAAPLCMWGGGIALGQSRTYTLDADFDEGVLQNVHHNVPDQLQLNLGVPQPFPFVNIAVSARGTAVRIDVNTGDVLGEYRTSPDGMGANPSRTTVDQFGNVWVTNRNEFGESPPFSGDFKGSLARIGLIRGGTRANADGSANPVGDYLSPPYLYNTCVDRDGDGLIKTSRGLYDIRSWTNFGGADSDGGVTTADDECIINYTRTVGTGTRAVGVDGNNDVWVGGVGDGDHEKIDGVTGLPVPATFWNAGCGGGYGGLVDGNGNFWSANGCGQLIRYDVGAATPACLLDGGGVPILGYGLGVSPITGNIWYSQLCGHPVFGGNHLQEISPAGVVLNSYPQPFGAQGVVVDGNDHVWVAEIFGANVMHWAPDPFIPGTHLYVGTVPGFAGTTGVAVDANGKIWASEINASGIGLGGRGAARIDPTAGPIGAGGYPVGAIDMTVGLGDDAAPYNYSDMTGFVVTGVTAPQGTWTVVYDTGAPGTSGCEVSWTSSEPAGTSISVEVRASDSIPGLAGEVFVPATNGAAIGVSGQYVEIRTTFARDPNVNDTPILFDLTISCNSEPDCSAAGPSQAQLWPPNHKFVDINIVGVTDPDGDPIAITIDSIHQDEPVLAGGSGSGNTSPDGTGVGTSTASVCAERNGNPRTPGNGRVYHIGYTADDGNGGTCSGVVTVCVPHDQRPGATCVDGGPLYDSTVP